MPMPRRRKLRPLCVPAGTVKATFAGRRRHLDLATEHGGGHRDVDLGLEVVAVSLEASIRSDRDDQIDVARGSAIETGPALAGHAHPLAAIDTRGNVHLERLGAPHEAGAIARRTLLTPHLAGAAARRAWFRDLQLNLPLGPRNASSNEISTGTSASSPRCGRVALACGWPRVRVEENPPNPPNRSNGELRPPKSVSKKSECASSPSSVE